MESPEADIILSLEAGWESRPPPIGPSMEEIPSRSSARRREKSTVSDPV